MPRWARRFLFSFHLSELVKKCRPVILSFNQRSPIKVLHITKIHRILSTLRACSRRISTLWLYTQMQGLGMIIIPCRCPEWLGNKCVLSFWLKRIALWTISKWTNFKEYEIWWTSLVVQWLRIHLPMQGTRVRSLVWEDLTCHGATKPMRHNC